MTAPEPRTEWRRKALWNRRLAWFGERPSEQYWERYWGQRIADGYFRNAARFDVAGDELGRVVLDQMSPEGPHIEAGCGAGFWVAALRAQGLEVVGIESSAALVSRVREVSDLPVHHGDALHIACPDGTYGTYLSFGVIEHDPAGPDRFLAEAYRVLRRGGRLIVTVPHHGPLRRRRSQRWRPLDDPPAEPFFQYGFTEDQMNRHLEEAGFTVLGARPLYVHRLLVEESPTYRRLTERRGSRWIERAARFALRGRDGHMLAVWGRRD